VSEDATAFQAHSGAPEGLTEVGQCSGPVGQVDFEVLRMGTHAITAVVVTATGTDSELAI